MPLHICFGTIRKLLANFPMVLIVSSLAVLTAIEDFSTSTTLHHVTGSRVTPVTKITVVYFSDGFQHQVN